MHGITNAMEFSTLTHFLLNYNGAMVWYMIIEFPGHTWCSTNLWYDAVSKISGYLK